MRHSVNKSKSVRSFNANNKKSRRENFMIARGGFRL